MSFSFTFQRSVTKSACCHSRPVISIVLDVLLAEVGETEGEGGQLVVDGRVVAGGAGDGAVEAEAAADAAEAAELGLAVVELVLDDVDAGAELVPALHQVRAWVNV